MTSNRKYLLIGLALVVLPLVVALLYWQGSIVLAAGSKTTNHPAVVASLPSPARKAEMLDANDLLVLHFDNSLNGENGETPAQTSGTSFVAGVSGSAISLPPGNLLTYQSAGNINAFEGTVEFWIKPNWNGGDNNTFNIFSWGVAGGLLIKKDPSTMSFSMNLFNAGGQPEIRAWPNISDWQANQWHHLACTWSNSNKTIKTYIDGQLKLQTSFTMSLPAINASTFRIGGFTTGSSGENIGFIDELRISGLERTAQEIAQHYLSSLTVSSLTVEPQSLHLFPGWFWTPKLTAVTNLGTMQVPSAGINWQSSNPSAAIVQSDGRIKSLAPGNVTLTANIQNATGSMGLLVKAPVLPPEVGPVPASLATPPSDSLHTIPVLVLRYLPTADGVNIDTAYDADLDPGDHFPLATLKSQIADYDPRVKFMLEEGSRFRGHSNQNAPHSLGYKVVQYITIYEPLPPGPVVSTSDGNTIYRADYSQIFERWDVRQAVENAGVKEIWFWAVPCYPRAGRPDLRPESYVSMWESNMSSPTTGDISNSNGDTADLPIYNKTYVVYSQNVHRTQAEAIHNHGHQLENILGYANQLQDGNTTLWWQQFARAVQTGATPPARCGNTHFPPNATQDYDYTNLNLVASDILNWQPSGGPTTMVNANTWGNVPYAWPGGTAPSQEVESKWYIFWFQSMAGRGNTIPYNSNHLTNWWQFTGDWDAAIQGGLGLYEPGSCSYALSATSQTVPLGGGTFTVNVTGGSGCKWIASSNDPWANVTGGSFGNGSGTVTFTVAAAGAARSGTLAIANQLFTINQTGGGCPTINVNPANPTLPQTGVGQAYNQTFSATGGVGAYTFSIVAGAAPAGLTLNAATGVLSGTVGSGLGTFNFTVRATDENNCIGERAYTLAVTSICPTITINPNSGSVPGGAVGTPYSLNFSASGGAAPYSYSVLVGILPLGLTLNATTGALTGTPFGGGSYTFTIRALDANNCVGTRVYTIVISGPCGFALNPASANFSAQDGGDFVNVTTANGCAWTASSNNTSWITIFDGASGSGLGMVAYLVAANPGPPRTGTMTIAGQTFTVTQSGGCPAISVNPANATLTAGTVGTAYSQTFTQTGGVGAVNFTVSAGALPTGLTLNSSTGVLSGTPTTANTFSFTVRATDVNNCTGERAYSLAINPAPPSCPAVSGIAPANGAVGASVVITGTNLTGVTAVKFNNNVTASFTVNSATQITATVPAGAATGPITISKTGCTDAQTAMFTVVSGNCVTVSISNTLRGGTGTSLIVPVTVGDLTGRGVVAYDFTVMFDPAVVSLPSSVFDNTGTLSGGMTITPNMGTPGKLTISAFGTLPLSGSGTLLNLKFNVIGAAGTCSDLTWTGFQFNEGTPCAATSNGRVCVDGSISGTVSYCVAPAKKVPGVVVTASSSQSNTTDSAGFYILNGLSGGAVTVTPTKTGDVNGISSFDASLAAQRAANLISFTSCQESAADASNNGVVSSFDASLIAQYAAGISNASSIAGTWKFAPVNRIYPSVTGNLTGQNYDAVLVGDVSGNWAAPGSSPLPAAVQVPVSLPNASGPTGASVTIPIMVGNLTGQGFMSYDFELTFDQNVLQLQNPPVDAVGTLSSGMTITPNPTPGRLRISAFGISPLAGMGTLLALKFNVVGAAGTTTTLNWQSFTFNEKIQTGLTNGSFAVCAAINLTPATLPTGTQGSPYNQTLSASGGTAPYNFSVSAGTLPGNLNLSSAGVLSGSPAAAGAFTFAVRTTDANGCFGERQYTLTINPASGGNGLQFYPLASPVRLLDTRPGASPNACSQPNAAIAGGTSRTQNARSFCGIPANAAAVTGNVTTVASGGGYLTLYPSGATQPTVASTNYNPNEVINNVFTVGLGAGDGAFKIFALNTTDVVVDVTGYYAPPATGGLYFHPLPAPVRLLETRAGQPIGCVRPGVPLTGGQDSLQTATTACTGIPAAARAIVGNATTVSPQGGGYLTLFPADAGRPLVASSNYNFNEVVNGPFTVGLSPTGQFNIFTLATTDLVVDVLGYYSTEANDVNGAGLLFTPLDRPVRLLETRAGQPIGCFKPGAPLVANQTYTQSARGLCDGLTIPASALGVVGNTTVVTPLGGGFLSLWPSSATQPTAATANYSPGQVVNRHFIVGLGNGDGAFKMFSAATTELVIDLSGYFAP